MPLTRMKLVDDMARPVSVGTVGEVTVQSPLLTLGYYKALEQTADAMKGGWFHTGDYAYRDEDGYYYFVDRKKDIIRRRGENISSAEVESVLLAHPDVLEAAVIPVPSELGEDEVKACIVPQAQIELNPDSLAQWCEARLARFKVPRYIEVRDSLPKTPTQKVEKYVLRQENPDSTAGCWDREKAGQKDGQAT
jgi:acyl-CoA synthetase (AMP-forming)/AMP-acid ligase II